MAGYIDFSSISLPTTAVSTSPSTATLSSSSASPIFTTSNSSFPVVSTPPSQFSSLYPRITVASTVPMDAPSTPVTSPEVTLSVVPEMTSATPATSPVVPGMTSLTISTMPTKPDETQNAKSQLAEDLAEARASLHRQPPRSIFVNFDDENADGDGDGGGGRGDGGRSGGRGGNSGRGGGENDAARGGGNDNDAKTPFLPTAPPEDGADSPSKARPRNPPWSTPRWTSSAPGSAGRNAAPSSKPARGKSWSRRLRPFFFPLLLALVIYIAATMATRKQVDEYFDAAFLTARLTHACPNDLFIPNAHFKACYLFAHSPYENDVFNWDEAKVSENRGSLQVRKTILVFF